MKSKLYIFLLLAFFGLSSNAQTWSALETGLDNSVWALAVYNGELYVGGDFNTAGNNFAKSIAKWNGTTWSTVGAAMWSPGSIAALAVYNGELYAGGSFTLSGGISVRIAKWDGTNWSEVGTGMNSSVTALVVYNGELYAGGSFTIAGGNPANRIAKWNGTAWSAVGTGMLGNNTSAVWALAVYNGELYAGGKFNTAGGNSANRIAKWDGSAWSGLGTGITVPQGIPDNSSVSALAVYNSELYVGGDFYNVGGNQVGNIAKWDGSTWPTSGMGLGLNTPVYSLAAYNGELFVGGTFTIAGGNPANRIAKWNGSAWSALGTGINSTVSSFAVYNAELYVGGAFSTAGGNPANKIAKYSSPSGIIEDLTNNQISFFPNPTSGQVKIISSGNIDEIKITDLLGQVIYQKRPNEKSLSLQLDNQGIYFITLMSENQIITKRLIVRD